MTNRWYHIDIHTQMQSFKQNLSTHLFIVQWHCFIAATWVEKKIYNNYTKIKYIKFFFCIYTDFFSYIYNWNIVILWDVTNVVLRTRNCGPTKVGRVHQHDTNVDHGADAQQMCMRCGEQCASYLSSPRTACCFPRRALRLWNVIVGNTGHMIRFRRSSLIFWTKSVFFTNSSNTMSFLKPFARV